MPNAKDINISEIGKPKFLLIGRSGAGKTTQILTFPGKTFVYFFDPAALSAVYGYDLEYEMFVPSVVNLGALSMSKEGQRKTTKTPMNLVDAHLLYTEFEKDFEDKIAKNFFKDYDTIAFDSLTTFSDIVMDRILQINGRVGQAPQQDDYSAQIFTIRNIIRTITGQMNMSIVCTGHEEAYQNDLTKTIQNEIILTGKLRAKLPLLFSEMWHLEHNVDTSGKSKYTIQTKPNRMNPACRTSKTFRDLDMFHDVTIPDLENPQSGGIGPLLKEHGFVVDRPKLQTV